jgi:hypothetical protein
VESLSNYEIQEQPEPEAFRVDDDAKATWAMRRLKHIVDQMHVNEGIAEAEMTRISSWLESVNRTLQNEAKLFEDMLIAYAMSEREKDRKSISTPYGVIRSAIKPPKVELDPEAFLSWAKRENRDDLLIHREPEPSRTAIKEAIEAGEKIEGAVLLEGNVSYSIKVSK